MTTNNVSSSNNSSFATIAAASTGAAAGSALTTKYAAPAILKFADNLNTDTFIKSEKLAGAVKKVKIPQIATSVANFVKKHPTGTAAIGAAVVALAGGLIGSAVDKSRESVSSFQG